MWVRRLSVGFMCHLVHLNSQTRNQTLPGCVHAGLWTIIAYLFQACRNPARVTGHPKTKRQLTITDLALVEARHHPIHRPGRLVGYPSLTGVPYSALRFDTDAVLDRKSNLLFAALLRTVQNSHRRFDQADVYLPTGRIGPPRVTRGAR
jgi:hypothetical protein